MTLNGTYKFGPQDVSRNASPTFAGLVIDSDTIFVDSVNHIVGIGTDEPSTQHTMTLRSTTGNAGYLILTPQNASGFIDFGDGLTGSDFYRGRILYSHASDQMIFYINSSVFMRLLSDGCLVMGASNANAKLHVVQDDPDKGVPVLILDQADIDDSFVYYKGTSAGEIFRMPLGKTTLYFEGDEGSKYAYIRKLAS